MLYYIRLICLWKENNICVKIAHTKKKKKICEMHGKRSNRISNRSGGQSDMIKSLKVICSGFDVEKVIRPFQYNDFYMGH